MTQEKTNVTIIGGGIVGSLLALILGSNGLKVVLVERDSLENLNSRSYDGRSYAINTGSQRLLAALDIWGKIVKDVQIVSEVLLQQGVDTSNPQPFELNFFDHEIANSPIFYMVEDRFLRRVILSKVTNCININHLTKRIVKGQKTVDGGIEITLNDGKSIKAEVAIGADGFPSESAGRAKIKNFSQNYKQSSITGVVRHKNSHNNQAFQYFLPTGPFAILPLTGNRSSYVWTMDTNEAKRIKALDDMSFLDKLMKVFDNRRGKIELDTPSSIFPISLALADNLVKEKFALIGDSAHSIHPIAGQGLNLGIRDVACLSEILISARRCGEDIGGANVLKRYSKWRTSDILTMALFTDITNKIFSNEDAFLKVVRGISFNFISKSTILKKILMKEASGLTGDVPRLLQGKNI